jgi:iduronate 2-sulfatase
LDAMTAPSFKLRPLTDLQERVCSSKRRIANFRSSILTGLRPDMTGILDNVKALFHENPDVVTLPAVFKDSGYYTARVGKVFHGTGEHDDPKAWVEKFDFDDNEIAEKGTGRNMTNGSVEWCRWLAAEGHDSDHSDGKNTLKAVELLSRKRDQNFFIAVGFHKPHDPFIAPKQYFDMYPLDEIVPPTVPGNIEEDSGVRIGSGWKRAFDEFSERDKKEFLRAYYACTTFVDAQIGKVLDAMDGLNLWKDTVVILLADHGYNLGEHNWWNKNVLYDHSCRVPLMVHAPGATAEGKTCQSIVESLDVFPTITDICGLTSPKNLEGVSFRPLICDPARNWKTGAYTQVRRGRIQGYSVRTKRWRYTEWDYGRAGKELYDHNNDPDEYHNLVNKAGLESVIRQHQELLHADKK